MLARRHFLLGLTSTLAAPAIVRAESLMPVKAMPLANALAVWAAQRLAEENMFLAGLSQCIAQTIIYGNPDHSPTQFTGFVGRWNSTP